MPPLPQHPLPPLTPLNLLALFTLCLPLTAAPLTNPDVDSFNVRLGTQTFGPRYQFTTNTVLVETAQAIHAMDSDIAKFYLGKGFPSQYPGITLPQTITNLVTLARDEPSCRQVLDMPFRHYVLWTYCFSATRDAWFDDGFTPEEQQKEHAEIYALTAYLLTQYNDSGKQFYLGHWEGDWYLLQGYDTSINPTAIATQGMIDWLNLRQQAVDDAKRDTPHSNVEVFHYTEVNRVRDAMLNPPSSNQRIVNAVLPHVPNLDFVSWSSYDGMNLPTNDIHTTLDYIESQLSTNKASAISGRRVWIGEYGWGGSNTSAQQEIPTRHYIQQLLPWSPRFILFWEMYDNENKAYWLIDNTNTKTPCYFLHQRFINAAKLQVARFYETHKRLPSDTEFSTLTTPLLDQPIPQPSDYIAINGIPVALSPTNATLTGSISPNRYGAEPAVAHLAWGQEDGGTSTSLWSHLHNLGPTTNFNPTNLSIPLTNLTEHTDYFYRFFCTNLTGTFWATNTATFRTTTLNTNAFTSCLQISFPGYQQNEPLHHFPALVQLNNQIAGFNYQQFASPSGADLRFTDLTRTREIPFEIDTWNTNGTSSIWVQLPLLSPENLSIWAYWGNPHAATNPANPARNVWSNGFELVYHLNETRFPFADSTTRHPAASGELPATTTGVIGPGINLNGTTTYLDSGTLDLENNFTLSAWLNLNPQANSIQTIWANKAGGSTTDGFALFANSWQTTDGRLLLETGNNSIGHLTASMPNQIIPSQWQHITAVVQRTNGTANLFVNGTNTATTLNLPTNFSSHASLRLGQFVDGLFPLKGSLDEARIESTSRSAAWIHATWLTVASNNTFTTYSTVQRHTPTLAVEPNQNQLTIRWPEEPAGFSLTTSSNPNTPHPWSTVTPAPTLTNNHWQLTLPITENPQQFYRLYAL